MTIAKILVPVRGDGKGEGVLEHAVALARAFAAHIETIYCQPQTRDMLPFGVVVPQVLRSQIENSMNQVGSTERERMRGLFEDFAGRHDLEVTRDGTVPPRDKVSLGWREAMGRQADLLGPHGRLADIIAVPRPDHDSNLGFNTLYAALMNTGRPVLMCPDGHPRGDLPGHVAVAWNGSIEASRAVALGTDLLSAASRVTILTAGTEAETGASGAGALKEYLAVRGVTAEHKALKPRGDIGAALLAGVQEAGADMLLMGAYSHSRGRESLFGGVSQHVVDHATIPVVLVH